MSHPNDLTVKRGKEFGQYLVFQHGKLVGEVAHTGTHLDHYPWDWFLADGVEPVVGRNATGVSETKREAVNCIGYVLGNHWGKNGGSRNG